MAVPRGLEEMAPSVPEDEQPAVPGLEGLAQQGQPPPPLALGVLPPSDCLIPAVDPWALQDLAALAVQVAAQVDELLQGVHGRLQAVTALSVGCLQTYRDGVESLGEAVDTGIRAMYTLVARCEELDRELQPVPDLAQRIRHLKSALERLEGLCGK